MESSYIRKLSRSRQAGERQAAVADAPSGTVGELLQLQHTFGNAAVTRLVEQSDLQRQTHATSGPLIQRAPGDRATQQQLLNALLKVLEIKIRKLVSDGIRPLSQQAKPTVDALPPALQTAVKTHLNNSTQACLVNLQPSYNQAAQAGLGELNTTSHGLLEQDVLPVNDISNDNTEYLFGFLYAQPVCTTLLQQQLTLFQQGMTALLSKVNGATVVINTNEQNLQTERNRLQTLVLQQFPQHQNDANQLGLAPLTNELTQLNGQALNAYNGSDPAPIKANALTTVATNLNHQTPGTLVVPLFTPAINLCDQSRTRYRKAANRVSAANIQAILPALGGTRKATMSTLIGLFGLPVFDAIVGLDNAVQIQCLNWCADQQFRTVLRQRMGANATAATLSATLSELGEATTGSQAFTVVQQANLVFIDVPPGVTVLAWQKIGAIRFPSAFSCAAFETDMACMKHQKEETVGSGALANPSKVKLERYFAELFSACQQAHQQWAQNKPAIGQYPNLAQAVATWAIHIKNDGGNAQVFHIDSRYQNSPWRTQPNT
jgi:hypothetical protein